MRKCGFESSRFEGVEGVYKYFCDGQVRLSAMLFAGFFSIAAREESENRNC